MKRIAKTKGETGSTTAKVRREAADLVRRELGAMLLHARNAAGLIDHNEAAIEAIVSDGDACFIEASEAIAQLEAECIEPSGLEPAIGDEVDGWPAVLRRALNGLQLAVRRLGRLAVPIERKQARQIVKRASVAFADACEAVAVMETIAAERAEKAA